MLDTHVESNSEKARLMLCKNRSKSRTRANTSFSRYVSSLCMSNTGFSNQ